MGPGEGSAKLFSLTSPIFLFPYNCSLQLLSEASAWSSQQQHTFFFFLNIFNPSSIGFTDVEPMDMED